MSYRCPVSTAAGKPELATLSREIMLGDTFTISQKVVRPNVLKALVPAAWATVHIVKSPSSGRN